MDRLLDTTCAGPLWLRIAPIADLVVDAIAFGQKELEHYDVGAFVVMPNHVHLLVIPHVSVPVLTRLGYTARQASLALGRTGDPFWQPESYDHWVRNDEEWRLISMYIESNPVGAGLAATPEEYPRSSAASAWNGSPAKPPPT